jgi:hypothetical protein
MVWTSHENNRSSDSAKYVKTSKAKNMVRASLGTLLSHEIPIFTRKMN